MPSVARIQLECARGEARTFAGTHQTSGSDTTAINITGWTLVVTVRDENKAVMFTKSGTIVSGAAGTYTWPVTAANTLISPKPYSLDIWRTDAGSETLMAVGTLTVNDEVRV